MLPSGLMPPGAVLTLAKLWAQSPSTRAATYRAEYCGAASCRDSPSRMYFRVISSVQKVTVRMVASVVNPEFGLKKKERIISPKVKKSLLPLLFFF